MVKIGDSLNPIRFERISGESVVVTSLAGEWSVVSAPEFEQLVAGTPVDIDLRRELVAKQILRSGNDLFDQHMLATKMAFRYRNIAAMCGLHIFVVTLRCEHSCHYCQVSRRTSNRIEFDMGSDIAVAAIDRVFESPSDSLKIEFQGGEPLLNFELIEFVVRQATSRAHSEGRRVDFVIASNLALLDDRIIEFAREFNVYFSTSLDGPQDLHNKARPRPGGDSYERAVAGIARIQRELGRDRVSALMTTGTESLKQGKSIIDLYVSLGLREIFLRQMSPFGFAARRGRYRRSGGTKWIYFYLGGLDYIIELNRSGNQLAELTAASYLRKMLRNDIGGYVDLMSPTGAGLATLVYNYDGDVYMSDEGRMLREMGDKSFCLGDVRAKSFSQLLSHPTLQRAVSDSFTWSSTSCHRCAFEPFCGADPVYHQATQSRFAGYKPISDFCGRTKAIVPELMRRYREDAFCHDLFESWADL